MINNLCCTLNPFFLAKRDKKSNKLYCRTCLKKTVSELLQKEINIEKLPLQIAKSQTLFLDDPAHFEDWQEVLQDKYGISSIVEGVIDRFLPDDVADEVVDEAWGVYDKLLTKATNRVKIMAV